MLSKPKLASSAGRKSSAAISTASRSRMALVYSVRFRRWKVAVRPGSRVSAQALSSSPSSQVRNASSSSAGRPRAAGRRHHPAAQLADHLLPAVGVTAHLGEIERVEGEPDRAELADQRRGGAAPAVDHLLVVAGDAVAVEQRAVGGAVVRSCRGDLTGRTGDDFGRRRGNGLGRRFLRGRRRDVTIPQPQAQPPTRATPHWSSSRRRTSPAGFSNLACYWLAAGRVNDYQISCRSRRNPAIRGSADRCSGARRHSTEPSGR